MERDAQLLEQYLFPPIEGVNSEALSFAADHPELVREVEHGLAALRAAIAPSNTSVTSHKVLTSHVVGSPVRRRGSPMSPSQSTRRRILPNWMLASLAVVGITIGAY